MSTNKLALDYIDRRGNEQRIMWDWRVQAWIVGNSEEVYGVYDNYWDARDILKAIR